MSRSPKVAGIRSWLIEGSLLVGLRNEGGRALLIALTISASLWCTPADADLPSGDSPRAKYSGAASDAKTALTQAIVYANDKGVYPTSRMVLRNGG